MDVYYNKNFWHRETGAPGYDDGDRAVKREWERNLKIEQRSRPYVL